MILIEFSNGIIFNNFKLKKIILVINSSIKTVGKINICDSRLLLGKMISSGIILSEAVGNYKRWNFIIAIKKTKLKLSYPCLFLSNIVYIWIKSHGIKKIID